MLVTKYSDILVRTRVNEFIIGVIVAKSVKFYDENPSLSPTTIVKENGILSKVIIDKVNECISHKDLEIDNSYLFYFLENFKSFIGYAVDKDLFVIKAYADTERLL